MEGRSVESRLSGMALFKNLRLLKNLETRKLTHEVGLFEFLAIAFHPSYTVDMLDNYVTVFLNIEIGK